MKIAIIGMPKTGTTALYNRIRANLPGSKFCIFEPGSADEVRGGLKIRCDHTLMKFMVHKLDRVNFNPNKFDKNIIIVRDPRDFLISSLLYRFNDPKVFADAARFKFLLEAFTEKEKDPKSYSCVSLFEMFAKNAPQQIKVALGKFTSSINEAVGQLPNSEFVLYEDMIDDDLRKLKKHLGFPISVNPEPKGWTSKIARTKNYGEWRNWFTENDIAFFSGTVSEFIAKYSYSNDWTLPSNPIIRDSTCSKYIKRLREQNAIDPMYVSKSHSIDHVHALESAVEDGKSLAMYKLAKIKLEGKIVDLDVGEAKRLFSMAAELGHEQSAIEYADLILAEVQCENKAEALETARVFYRKAALKNNKTAIEKIVWVLNEKQETKYLAKKWQQKLLDLT